MKTVSLKKALSLLLAVVLAISLCIPTFAAPKKADADPILIITGFSQYPLINLDNGEAAFAPSSEKIVNTVTEVLPAFATLLASGKTKADYDALCDAALPVVNKLFEEVSCNPDGTVKYTNVGLGYQYPESAAFYADDAEAHSNIFDNALVQGAIDAVGADKVYVYGLDWRLTPSEIADDLQSWILHIKAQTGSDKVSVAGISMGGAMLSAYVAKYGTANISHITMISSAFTGLSYIGELFKGHVSVDEQGLYNLLNNVLGTDVLSKVLGATGILKQVLPLVDDLVSYCGDRLYSECLIPSFGYTAGIWAFVPADDYAAAKDFMFAHMQSTAAEQATLEAKLDEYHAIQAKAEATLKAAKADGVQIAVVSNYNLQMPPVSAVSDMTGDQVIETHHTSGFATCAKLGETLPASVKDGKYVSADRVIDASTCMFPNETWFIKNMQHVGFSNAQNQCKFYAWLMTADKPVTVNSNADYPQFMLYNDQTKVLSPLAMLRGDVNFDGVVNLIDARLTLRYIHSLDTLSPLAKEAADMDENSKISHTDVQGIMNAYAGIEAASNSSFSADQIKDAVSGITDATGDTSSPDISGTISGITDKIGEILGSFGSVGTQLAQTREQLADAVQALPEHSAVIPTESPTQAEQTTASEETTAEEASVSANAA